MKKQDVSTPVALKGRSSRRVPPRQYVQPALVPRGEFSRPVRAYMSIEIFEERDDQFPNVIITAEAHGKMRALIAACPIEVLWLSPTRVEDNGDVVIYDVLVPLQVCTSGSTEKLKTKDIDGEDQLLSELMEAGKFDMIRDLICWGHSHVNFGTFASSVDEAQTDYYLNSMREMGKRRFVRLIANKGDDLFASIYMLDEGKAIHHAPINAEPPETEKWEAWAKRQIKEKVSTPKPRINPSAVRVYGGGGVVIPQVHHNRRDEWEERQFMFNLENDYLRGLGDHATSQPLPVPAWPFPPRQPMVAKKSKNNNEGDE